MRDRAQTLVDAFVLSVMVQTGLRASDVGSASSEKWKSLQLTDITARVTKTSTNAVERSVEDL